MGSAVSTDGLPDTLDREACEKLAGQYFNEDAFKEGANEEGVVTKEYFIERVSSFDTEEKKQDNAAEAECAPAAEEAAPAAEEAAPAAEEAAPAAEEAAPAAEEAAPAAEEEAKPAEPAAEAAAQVTAEAAAEAPVEAAAC